MKYKYLLSAFSSMLLFIMLSQNIFGQSDNNFIIPKVTPPSPESAQLGKFGLYEVSYFTGLPDIEIPIYEIAVKDIKVPISLKYHPSGIKVTDRAGLVGLGWALQAGGYISRQVMSKPDERPEGYLNGMTVVSPIDPGTYAGLEYLHKVYTGEKDAEPDIFSYSFGNVSGKFVFNQSQGYKKVMIPYNPVKIKHFVSNNSLSFNAYDQDGKFYRFSSYEESENYNDNFSVRSNWKLSSITSKNKNDSILFTYGTTSGQTYVDINESIYVDDLVYNGCGCSTIYNSNTGIGPDLITQSIFSTEKVLQTIVFPQGKVEFSLISDRQDGYYEQKRLDAVNVYSKDPSSGIYYLRKTITFFQNYFQGPNDKRLKLDSLYVKDALGSIIQKYKFEYNSTTLPDFNSKMRDYWGYYNGKANTTLIPRQTIPWQTNSTANPTTITIGSIISDGREPDSTLMRVGILNKIVYPTGGWTEFEYETNQYFEGTTKLAGGLRIKRIKNYTASSTNPIVKTFKYGLNESGYGRKNFIMDNYSFQSQVTTMYHNCGSYSSKRTRTFVSNPSVSIEPYDASPVVYANVTVYEGTSQSNSGKTIYEYSDFEDNHDPSYAIGVPAIESNHYKRGQLLTETTYKNDGGQFKKVQAKINTYGAYPDSSKSYIGLKVKRITINEDKGGASSFGGSGDVCYGGDLNAFRYTYYRVITGDTKLTSTTTKQYDSNGLDTLSQSTFYNYDNYSHQQVTKTTTNTSDGSTILSTFRYPTDINTGVYASMANLNMLSSPIEQTKSIDNYITGGNLTTYKLNNGSYVPDKAYSLEITSPLSSFNNYNGSTMDSHYNSTNPEINFEFYDTKSNILQTTGKDGIVTSYLWDATGSFPMAQVKGASYSQISTQNGQTANYSSLTLRNSLNGLAPSAFIQTFSYKPLYGVTSQTDPNGKTTSYVYDNFGRLFLIKDNLGKILKKYDYHYSNK
jgi:YD repeat-containing protein